MKTTMIAPLRVQAGLGHPPARFTTNWNEAINNMIKKALNYKETDMVTFCQHMKNLIQQQYDDVHKAIRAVGEFQFVVVFASKKCMALKCERLNHLLSC